MQQLFFIAPGRLQWREVIDARLESGTDAVVRPLAVARCDLDAALLWGLAPFRGRLLHWLRNHLPTTIGQDWIFRKAPFRGPYAFGHEFVGEVCEVGGDVRNFAPGARVVVPFQISCGTCDHCRRGLSGSCLSVPPRSMYGFGELGGHRWGGALADRVRVPFADHMLLPLPPGVTPADFASPDNVPDGYRCVAGPLRDRPGGEVLVVGGGAISVGLYAVACAVALGASRVDYFDVDDERLELSRRLGARPVRGPVRSSAERYPITVDASADPAGLSRALLATAPGGVCTSVGIYYQPTTPVPLLAMYGTGVTFVTGRVNARACLPEVLRLVADGRLRPREVTTRIAPWSEAAEALLDRGPKVVIVR
jgi:alcohol dehydrogenase